MAAKKSHPRLRIIPLGGLDEIGKNMTVLEYENDIIIIDCGLSFPQLNMPGVDLVIPDISYLIKNKEKIRAFFITHGHEDHIGALPYALRQLAMNVPVYGTRLTLGLIGLKLKEHRMPDVPLREVRPGASMDAGVFNVEFINVNHSICGAVAMAIKTPVGMVVFTGDFKIDFTPIDNNPTDLQRFAELGKRGVLALFMDSTNAERPGYTMSERTVGETFNDCFERAAGRIIVAMFASNVHRIQQVVDAAVKYNRYVLFNGRSMINVANLASELGYLEIPEGRQIDVDQVDFYDEDEVVIITTGSQGEELAGLTRMAFSEHRKLDIRKTDTVIVSATPVPGNERFVSRVINQLFRKGANVVYEALDEVHVSGHARQEELKIMHALIRPRFFIPVHGEYKHLHSHVRLAVSMGMDPSRVILMQSGDVLECTRGNARKNGTVQTGAVMVDGLGIGDVGSVVLRDRKLLSQDGLIAVVAAVDKKTGNLLVGPDIISRGFVYTKEKESEQLMDDARERVTRAIADCQRKNKRDINAVRSHIRDDLKDFMYQKTGRSPIILPLIQEIPQP